MAARRMTTEERAALDFVVKRMRRLVERRDVDRYVALNRDFHEMLYAASHNRYVHTQARSIFARLAPYRRQVLLRPGQLEISQTQHERIRRRSSPATQRPPTRLCGSIRACTTGRSSTSSQRSRAGTRSEDAGLRRGRQRARARLMELWVLISLAAAALQAVRTALQKHLAASLPNHFVKFARFAFGAPLAAIMLCAWLSATYAQVPTISVGLIGWCALIAVSQIMGTWALISAFRTRNFAVAITFSKTETLQTALLSLIIIGEALPTCGVGCHRDQCGWHRGSDHAGRSTHG